MEKMLEDFIKIYNKNVSLSDLIDVEVNMRCRLSYPCNHKVKLIFKDETIEIEYVYSPVISLILKYMNKEIRHFRHFSLERASECIYLD